MAMRTEKETTTKSKGGQRKWHASTMTRERPNKEQRRVLEEQFARNPLPDSEDKERIVQLTGMTPKRVRTWFQNKRARERAKVAQKQKQKQSEEEIRAADTRDAVGALSSLLPKAREVRLPAVLMAGMQRGPAYVGPIRDGRNGPQQYSDMVASASAPEPDHGFYHQLYQQHEYHQQQQPHPSQRPQQHSISFSQQHQQIQQQVQQQYRQQYPHDAPQPGVVTQEMQPAQQHQQPQPQPQPQQQPQPPQRSNLQGERQLQHQLQSQQLQPQRREYSSLIPQVPMPHAPIAHKPSHASLGRGLDRYRLSSPSFDPRWPPSSTGSNARDSSVLPPMSSFKSAVPTLGERGLYVDQRQYSKKVHAAADDGGASSLTSNAVAHVS